MWHIFDLIERLIVFFLNISCHRIRKNLITKIALEKKKKKKKKKPKNFEKKKKKKNWF